MEGDNIVSISKQAAKNVLSRAFGHDASSFGEGWMNGANLVTFDVFDTLVIRSCGEPGAVFDIVGKLYVEENPEESLADFRAMRERAEQEARSAVGSSVEVTLEDIYEHLPFPNAVRNELMELELAVELAVCEPNHEMLQYYSEALESVRVAIISDTYLPAWFVRAILDECGIDGYERLLVSSDCGSMKRDGRVFEVVLKELGVSTTRAMHVGDHPLADWIAPRRIGMKACLYRATPSSMVGQEAMTDVDGMNADGQEFTDDNQNTELQLILLEILKAVVDICDRNSIPYFLVEGTCLGAVRHGGMIPWDDDIDIAIPATSCFELGQALARELPKRYRVVQAFSEEGEEVFRVLDSAVKVEGGLFSDSRYDNPMIDILLICGMPSNLLLREVHHALIWSRLKVMKFADPGLMLERDRGRVGNAITAVAKLLSNANLVDGTKARSRLQKAMCKYPIVDDGFVFCLTWYGRSEMMPSSIYGAGRKCKFDRLSLVIPERAEEYLARLYGEWQKLPPVEERVGKHSLTIIPNKAGDESPIMETA